MRAYARHDSTSTGLHRTSHARSRSRDRPDSGFATARRPERSSSRSPRVGAARVVEVRAWAWRSRALSLASVVTGGGHPNAYAGAGGQRVPPGRMAQRDCDRP
jgi:hypothetical protein